VQKLPDRARPGYTLRSNGVSREETDEAVFALNLWGKT
jgi:hypothetical protein